MLFGLCGIWPTWAKPTWGEPMWALAHMSQAHMGKAHVGLARGARPGRGHFTALQEPPTKSMSAMRGLRGPDDISLSVEWHAQFLW